MSISWLKYSNDKNSFKIFKALGMDVFEIKDLDRTDEKIEELIRQNYTTIILSSQVASFSQDIIKKYSKKDNINIIIAPGKFDKL